MCLSVDALLVVAMQYEVKLLLISHLACTCLLIYAFISLPPTLTPLPSLPLSISHPLPSLFAPLPSFLSPSSPPSRASPPPRPQTVGTSGADLQDYMYYFTPAPWLSVMLLKLVQMYPAPGEDDALTRARLVESIEAILSRSQVSGPRGGETC